MSLGGFLRFSFFSVGAPAQLGLVFGHFSLSVAVRVHRFGLGCFGHLGGHLGYSRSVGKTLSSGTGLEDVDVLDPATPQLRGIGTSGSYLQVDFLNPPRQK